MDIYQKHVFVCVSGKTCPGEGSEAICSELRKQVNERGLKGKVRINKSGCLDQCGNGAVMVVYPEATWYAHVKLEDVSAIVEEHLLGNKPVERLLYDGRGRIREDKAEAKQSGC